MSKINFQWENPFNILYADPFSKFLPLYVYSYYQLWHESSPLGTPIGFSLSVNKIRCLSLKWIFDQCLLANFLSNKVKNFFNRISIRAPCQNAKYMCPKFFLGSLSLAKFCTGHSSCKIL